MTMNSVVEPDANGGSNVRVQAHVQLAGKVVRFGRGMIQGVSAQLFKEFGERMRGNLEAPPASAEGAAEASTALQASGVSGPPAKREDSLNLVALFFRALWAGIKAFFRRLAGKKQPS